MSPKTGDEPLHIAGQPVDFKLLDFWQWSGSDILGNALRGKLAEYIVAIDIGCESGTRQEWDAYDLITSAGVKVEVKSSAYIQSWSQEKLSTIKFGIQPTYGWDTATNKIGKHSRRQADVYVFCVLANKDERSIDPLDMSQWDFYALATNALNERLGLQKTITLSSLLALNPIFCKFGGIPKAIDRALERYS